MSSALKSFQELLDIMDRLRKECPWDKKQTLASIRHLSIEEVYELSDAILENSMDDIKKELGDLLLHIVFYAKIASETDSFNITDVIDSINKKLITRHPHIFSDVLVKNADEVKQNWEKIKLKEGSKSTLAGVPPSLPAMIKAYRIQEKARGIGFDWEHTHQVWDKVKEELEELRVEVEKNDKEKTEEEFGDLMFALINYARFIDVNPEDALEKTNRKFMKRFNFIEEEAKKAGKSLKNMSLAEMDVFWNDAKKHFKS